MIKKKKGERICKLWSDHSPIELKLKIPKDHDWPQLDHAHYADYDDIYDQYNYLDKSIASSHHHHRHRSYNNIKMNHKKNNYESQRAELVSNPIYNNNVLISFAFLSITFIIIISICAFLCGFIFSPMIFYPNRVLQFVKGTGVKENETDINVYSSNEI